MSLVKISGNASGTGTMTIAAPNTNTDYTLTLPTQTGTLVSGTTTAGVAAPAGTTTLAPILLTSGTNLTSATAGAVEYDGKVVYVTPLGTQRGIVPTQQYYRLNADYVGTNGTSAQNLFGVGVTLSSSTVYEIETMFVLSKSAGTTSHNVSLSFAGTATVNNILYDSCANQSGSSSFVVGTVSGAYTVASNIATAVAISISAISSAAASLYVILKGTVSINAGGTFIPQYTLSAAPGGAYSTTAGSYIRINPLSASGANTSVGTWA
jgi:hypothetical protein